MNIANYGWNEHFQQEWNERASTQMYPARIIADHGQLVRVMTDAGDLLVNRSHAKQHEEVQLAVGDWVALITDSSFNTTQIYFVLSRRTKFSRAAAGLETKEQIIAANVDTVFLIQSLNRDFNMRRLERYLIATWESGATPVVILTKADCCDDVDEKISIVQRTAPGVDVHGISCITKEGLDQIQVYLRKGKTIALLGSSGVGKSTLVNTLAGEELFKTNEIREDDSKGRHTTTHRELILLPNGGLILDTPGMRSLSLWESSVGMETMFGDIDELTASCRFHDCSHQSEPGCAIIEALEAGTLSVKRWESWVKLQKELAHIDAKRDNKLQQKEKQRGKQLAKFQKEFYKERV